MVDRYGGGVASSSSHKFIGGDAHNVDIFLDRVVTVLDVILKRILIIEFPAAVSSGASEHLPSTGVTLQLLQAGGGDHLVAGLAGGLQCHRDHDLVH